MNRATSAGGRWENTLYHAREHPFIHALDTERRQAFCIDLDCLAGRRNGMWGVKLEFDGPGTWAWSRAPSGSPRWTPGRCT